MCVGKGPPVLAVTLRLRYQAAACEIVFLPAGGTTLWASGFAAGHSLRVTEVLGFCVDSDFLLIC